MDRVVALKILPPEAVADPAFAERFTREARTMANLSHANIVTVFDTGQTEFTNVSGETTPLYYFTMEYVDGVNLREAQQTGELSPQQALRIVPQVCDALQYAHDHGVVHRDIKPENVLLDKSGRVKVADFGLSKLRARTPVNVTLTASHQVMGTLHYMAPEQMQRPAEVDHRADIYSLGVVLYELLTGEVPIGRFPLPSEKLQTDLRLDEVVLRAMEREPDRRYQQASDVKTDIESLSAQVSAVSRPAQRKECEAKQKTTSIPAMPDDEAALLDARRQVQIPAIGLIAVGTLNVLPLALWFLGLLVACFFAGFTGAEGSSLFPLGLRQDSLLLALIYSMIGGLHFGMGVVMIVGGLKMSKLETCGLAVLASILAVLPSVLFLLSVPVGIWSLIVLFRPKVEAAFDSKRTARLIVVEGKPTDMANVQSAKQQLRGPAIGLFGAALPTFLVWIVMILYWFLMFVFGSGRQGPPLAMLVVPCFALPCPSVIALAAYMMIRLKSYWFAVLGSVLAVLPLHLGFLIGVPFGIWSMIVLFRPEVRASFRHRTQELTPHTLPRS